MRLLTFTRTGALLLLSLTFGFSYVRSQPVPSSHPAHDTRTVSQILRQVLDASSKIEDGAIKDQVRLDAAREFIAVGEAEQARTILNACCLSSRGYWSELQYLRSLKSMVELQQKVSDLPGIKWALAAMRQSVRNRLVGIDKVNGLGILAESLRTVGRQDESHQVLRSMLEQPALSGPRERAFALAAAMTWCFKLRDYELAFSAFESVPVDGLGLQHVIDISTQRFFESLGDGRVARNDLLDRYMAVMRKKIGKPLAGKDLAALFSLSYPWSSFLAMMVKSCAPSGDIEYARKLVGEMKVLDRMKHKAGTIDDAGLNESNYVRALGALAVASARAHDDRSTAALVKELLGEIEGANDELFDRGMVPAIEAEVHVNHLARALDMSRKLHSWGARAKAVTAIARARARAEDLAGARKLLHEAQAGDESQEDEWAYKAIMHLAEAQLLMGDIAGARRNMARYHRYKMELEREGLAFVDLYTLLSLYAVQQVKHGDTEGAVETLKQITPKGLGKHFFLDTVGKVAVVQADSGDLTGASRTLNLFPKDTWASFLATAYRGVAAARLKFDGTKGAIAWASSVDAPAPRAFALLGIANGLTSR